MSQYTTSAGPIPRGDAFLALTPEIDHARDQLFQQQREREVYGQRQSMELDKEMAKEFAGIKNADAPDVIGAYGKYKDAMKDVYFNPKLQNDPTALNAATQKANQELSSVYGGIEASKQHKQLLHDMLVSYSAHPEKYQDNFGDLYKAALNTPVSKLGNVPVNGKNYDLSNPSTFFDDTPPADMNKMVKFAAGTAGNKSYEDTPIGSDGVQVNRTTYKYGASPAEFSDSLVSQFHDKKAGKYAAQQWSSIDPTEVSDVDEKYNNISPEQWKKMTGSETPQSLPDYSDNKADNLAIYLAKKRAITATPSMESKPYTVAENKINLQEQNKKTNMAISFNYRQSLQKSGSALALDRQTAFDDIVRHKNDLSEGEKDQAAVSYVGGLLKEAKSVKAESYSDASGKKVEVHPVDLPTEIKSQLALQKGTHKIEPNTTGFSADGSHYIGVFKNADGTVVTTSQPVNSITPIVRNMLSKGKTDKVSATPAAPSKKPKFF